MSNLRLVVGRAKRRAARKVARAVDCLPDGMKVTAVRYESGEVRLWLTDEAGETSTYSRVRR